MKTILFVCTGNTCRSPLAAAMFNKLAPSGYRADSCGLYASNGEIATKGSRAAAKHYGVSIDTHIAKNISDRLVRAADAIYCLTAQHAAVLGSDYPNCKDKIFTLAEKDIADPFGKDDDTYLACAEEIFNAVQAIIAKL